MNIAIGAFIALALPWHAKLANELLLLLQLVFIVVNLRFVLDDRVTCRAHFIDLTAKVVIWEWGQVLGHTLSVAHVPSRVQLSLATSILFQDRVDIDMSI